MNSKSRAPNWSISRISFLQVIFPLPLQSSAINTQNADIKIDTYQARKSLGLVNLEDSVKQYSQKGKEHITKLIQEYVQTGKALGKIQDGVDIGDVIRQKIIEMPMLYTTTLPSAGADISCEPASIDMSYEPGDVSLNWQINDTSYVYQPGSFRMKIVEYPHVDVEYLGGPMYVPPSANPDFKETAEG